MSWHSVSVSRDKSPALLINTRYKFTYNACSYKGDSSTCLNPLT